MLEHNHINLWGLPPTDIGNFFNVPIHVNGLALTNRLVNGTSGPVIGHGETVNWYEENVVDTGKVASGTVWQ